MRAEKARGYSAKLNLGCDLSPNQDVAEMGMKARPHLLSATVCHQAVILLLFMFLLYMWVPGVYKSLFLFSGIHSFTHSFNYHSANTYGELLACRSLGTG